MRHHVSSFLQKALQIWRVCWGLTLNVCVWCAWDGGGWTTSLLFTCMLSLHCVRFDWNNPFSLRPSCLLKRFRKWVSTASVYLTFVYNHDSYLILTLHEELVEPDPRLYQGVMQVQRFALRPHREEVLCSKPGSSLCAFLHVLPWSGRSGR